jgi:hypothetical protein
MQAAGMANRLLLTLKGLQNQTDDYWRCGANTGKCACSEDA